MIYFRVHSTPHGDMIALCDSELLGNYYKEGKAELDLKTYSDFYKGDLVQEEKMESMPELDHFYTANVVGPRSVGIFIKKGIISTADVKKVKETPFVHVYKIV